MIGMAKNTQDQIARMSAAQQSVPVLDAPVDPHATLTAPIGPPPMSANELGDSLGPTNELGDALPQYTTQPQQPPAIMSLQPQQDAISRRLMADYKKDADPYGSPDNHPGFGGKLLHTLSVIGNTAGDIISPTIMSRIPQSNLHRQIEEENLEKRQQDLAKDESSIGLQGAQAEDATARAQGQEGINANQPRSFADTHDKDVASTRETNARAAALENPAPEYEVHDTVEGPMIVNKKTGIGQHLSVNGLPVGPKVATKIVQLEIHGKQHQVLVNDADGTIIRDMGESGEKPPTVNVNAAENRQFQEQERGRGLLDKAESAYRTAEQGANTMRDMVASARAGNKMSAQVLPLEGALAITTAQGVHRINRTEVDQYAGAGSLYDKIVGELGKTSAGQPIPQNILNDIIRLTDIQQRGAYQTYKGAYDSATRRYHLSDEKPLDGPAGATQGPTPGTVEDGYRFKGGNPKDAANWEKVAQ